MVKIIGYTVRTNKEGENFVTLQLQGDIVMVQSGETGRFYATTKSATMPSTFTEDQADSLLGKEIQGRIEKVACQPYEYTVESTGEVITLNHRWQYVAESVPTPLRVVHKEAA